MNNLDDEYITIKELGEYAHVMPATIYLNVKKQNIKCKKVKNRIYVSKRDYDLWRSEKYNPSRRKSKGEVIFDPEKGIFSVEQVCKVISFTIGRPYNIQKIYAMLKIGLLKGYKKGNAWIILKDDALALLEKEQSKQKIEHQFSLF